jgi:inward rectifier potassium channel
MQRLEAAGPAGPAGRASASPEASVAGPVAARLLDRDGHFNVRRIGVGWRHLVAPYEALLSMSWPRFLGTVIVFYLAANALFAIAYELCGPQGLTEAPGLPFFWRCFFFSVTTFATIGYGHISPVGMTPHVIMTVESFLGALSLALVTGMAFARFARPLAKVQFSKHAVVAPHRGGWAFMFRVVNLRRSQLIEVEAKVLLSRRVATEDGRSARRFLPLQLERDGVLFFPTAWTIAHPIDRDSPLHGLTLADLEASEAEFIVLLKGVDEASGAGVNTRTSYVPRDVAWAKSLVPLASHVAPDGTLLLDVRHLDEVE